MTTAKVRLPGALRDLVGAQAVVALDVPVGATVADVLDALGRELPAVERRIRDEGGALRRHVNVFVGAANVRDLAMLATPVPDDAEVHILPSVSGGLAGAGRPMPLHCRFVSPSAAAGRSQGCGSTRPRRRPRRTRTTS